MKILMLSEYPYLDSEQALGGIMQATYQLVEGFSSLEEVELELHVVSTSLNCYSPVNYRKGQIHFHFIPRSKDVFAALFVTPIRLLFHLFLLNRSLKPDLIHGQGTVTFLLLSLLLGRKSVQTIHGIYRNEQLAIPRNQQSILTRFKFLCKSKLENYYLKNVKNVIAITNEITELLASEGNKEVNIFSINNAIDVGFFHDYQSKFSSYLKNTGSDKPIRLLFVAAITPRKGLHILVQSFKKIAAQHSDVHLTIAGIWDWAPDYVQEQMSSCSDLISSGRIEFTGGIERNRLIDLFMICDIFVLPSFAESAPMVISQALCAGLPVISTNVGGIPEMVENGITGLLVEPGNVPALEGALNILIGNSKLREQMGKAAKAVGFSRYHPKSIASATLSAYKKIVLR